MNDTACPITAALLGIVVAVGSVATVAGLVALTVMTALV
jgi:hypothetical protein